MARIRPYVRFDSRAFPEATTIHYIGALLALLAGLLTIICAQ